MTAEKTLIFSDAHIFFDASTWDACKPLVYENLTDKDRLILNGDIFELHFPSLPPEEAVTAAGEVLDEINRYFPGLRKDYVMGNHDNLEALKPLLETHGFTLHESYLQYGDVLVTHGHLQLETDRQHKHLCSVHRRLGLEEPERFDTHTPWTADSWFTAHTQRYSGLYAVAERYGHPVMRTLGMLDPDKQTKTLVTQLEKDLPAETYGNIRHIFTGHTHIPYVREYDGKTVYNTGCMLERRGCALLSFEMQDGKMHSLELHTPHHDKHLRDMECRLRKQSEQGEMSGYGR